jgi:predicted Zn-dependent peptidase
LKGIDIRLAEESVHEVLAELLDCEDRVDEMQKVKNRFESSTVFANTSILNKAANLAFYELIGSADLINNEVENYCSVTPDRVREAARRYFSPANCSTLCYISSKKV